MNGHFTRARVDLLEVYFEHGFQHAPVFFFAADERQVETDARTGSATARYRYPVPVINEYQLRSFHASLRRDNSLACCQRE